MQSEMRLLASMFGVSLLLSGCPGANGKGSPAKPGTGSGGSFELIEAGTDPFFKYQWYIENTGQPVFAASPGIAGKDINLSSTLRSAYSGRNVEVLVSDDGLESTHEDLSANFNAGKCKNYYSAPVTGFKQNADPARLEDNHGTAVSGIIAAGAENGRGIRGIAYGASISNTNFLSAGVSQTTEVITDQAAGDFDIYNYSWGSTQNNLAAISGTFENQLKTGTQTYRGGKGAIYAKAAGNDFMVYSVNDNLRIGNANYDSTNSTPYTIVVGASNAEGNSTSYSSPGANLWITAPGGEDGEKHPAIATTDRTGCTVGYANSSSKSTIGFEKGTDGNGQCKYTTSFNGTSSATPVVSGSLALILEANPNLNWRDVKHILVTSSDAGVALPLGPTANNPIATLNNPPGHTVWEQGWVRNQAGYRFHNWYGFGTLNLEKAIDAAKIYASTWGPLQETVAGGNWKYNSATLNASIPDFSGTGVTDSITVPAGDALIIEAVQIRLDITHTNVGDLGIELRGPTGSTGRTKSILMNVNNSLDGTQNMDFADILLTNAFYGETTSGDWEVKVIDGKNTKTGTLNKWSIKFFGHAP